jgi:hypothetical protein
MVHNNNRKHLFLLLLPVFLISSYFMVSDKWSDDKLRGNISSDAAGYYDYLPRYFIDKPCKHTEAHWFNKTAEGKVNKYWIGTAVLESPFFFCAHAIAQISGHKADGYSAPYYLAISLAALFYGLLGIYFLYSFLLLNGVSTKNALLSCLLFYFGSNLFTTLVWLPGFSHTYSFFAVSAFLYFSKRSLGETIKTKYLFAAAAFAGLVVLIRPSNAIVLLLLPLLGLRLGHLRALPVFKILAAGILFSAIVLLQSLMWYKQTGHFFVTSLYLNEGFYFKDPAIFSSLFSYSNGLFVYTPILLLSFLSLPLIFRLDRFFFFNSILYIIILIYLTASWWCWNYAAGFGLRPFIDHYPFFILLFALLLQYADKLIRWTALALAILFLALNCIQTYQYNKNILAPVQMQKDSYWYVFLRTGDEYVNSVGAAHDIEPFNKFTKRLIFEKEYEEIIVADSSREYSGEISFPLHDTVSNRHFAEVSFKLREQQAGSSASEAILVLDVTQDNRKVTKYYSSKLKDLPRKYIDWHSISHEFIVEKMELPSTAKLYIWNKGRQKFEVKDLKIKFSGYTN